MTTLLTEYDAAEILVLSSSTVQRLAQRNLIPHVRLPGGEVRFCEDDLRRWIEKHKSSVEPGGPSR